MSSQTVYFTNPSEITSIQSQVTDLQTTQANYIGKYKNAWTNLNPVSAGFAYQNTGTIVAVDTWICNGKDLSNTRYTKPTNPIEYLYLKDYRLSKSHPFMSEQLGQIFNGSIDENYIYIMQSARLGGIDDFKEGPYKAAYQSVQQAYDHAVLLDFSWGLNSAISKFDRFTLEHIKTSPLVAASGVYFVGTSSTPISFSAGRYGMSKGAIALQNNAVYFTCFFGPYDTDESYSRTSIMKYDKDLNFQWAWEPEIEDRYQKYYVNAGALTHVYFYAATGARNYDILITASNCVKQYTSSFGVNLFNPSISTNIYGKPQITNPIAGQTIYGDDARGEFTKWNPGYFHSSGKIFGVQEMGTYAFQKWEFSTCPIQLVENDYYREESIIPGKSETYLYYNLWASGALGTHFQQGIPGAAGMTGYYDTRGIGYTGTDGSVHHGHWLFTNYTGYIYDTTGTIPSFLGALSTYGDNKVAFFDFMDATNAPKLNNGNFDSTKTYRGYRMTGAQWFGYAPSNQYLWCPAEYNSLSYRPDFGAPVDIPGTVLEGQLITKRLFTGAKDNYQLDKWDAYHLNYYGAGIYGSWCYDPTNDNIYIGTANGAYAPLDDMIAAINTETSEGKFGMVNDTFNATSVACQNYNLYLTTGAEYSAGANTLLQEYIDERTKFDIKAEEAMINSIRSPRGNRWLYSSLLSLSVGTGKLNWAQKTVHWDGFDWNGAFGSVAVRFFFDVGFNSDFCNVALVSNPGNIKTTNGRMILGVSKDSAIFLDPDANPRVPISATDNHPSDTTFYQYGLKTMTGAAPQGPLLKRFFHQNGGMSFYEFNNGATDGIHYVAKINGDTKLKFALPLGQPDDSYLINIPIQHPELGSAGTYTTWKRQKAQTSYFVVYNLLNVGTQDLYPSMTGALPTVERIIRFNDDLYETDAQNKFTSPMSYDGRNGTMLYGRTAISSLLNSGQIIGHDILTSKKVMDINVGYNGGACPIILNDILYPQGGKGNITPANIDSQAGTNPPTQSFLGGAYNLMMFTQNGL